MASQYFTIAKIGGLAAVETIRRFTEWNQQRTADNPTEWDPMQWPANVRNEADAWAGRLREHGHEPPVVFFAEYVDLWSSDPARRFLVEMGLLSICANRFELSCLPLPLSPSARNHLAKVKKSGQWSEDRFFATVTLHAADAWGEIVEEAVLVFLRRVIGGLVEDDAIEASLLNLPDWIKRQ
jgi:hypothetical protein